MQQEQPPRDEPVPELRSMPHPTPYLALAAGTPLALPAAGPSRGINAAALADGNNDLSEPRSRFTCSLWGLSWLEVVTMYRTRSCQAPRHVADEAVHVEAHDLTRPLDSGF